MLLKVILVGKTKDRLIADRIAEYSKRLNAYCKLETVYISDSTVAGEGAAIVRELEKERNSKIFILSEEGREFTSPQMGEMIKKLDCKAVFVIGGAFGLADEVKAKADVLWSLSKLTFPHEIAALLLFEQLYRACNISHGGSYHH